MSFCDMLDLKDALDLVDTGRWVSLAYVGYDQKRRTSGNIIRVKRCRLATGKSEPGIPRDSTSSTASGSRSKSPNHHEHFTRNMKLANGQIRKTHPRLWIAINGQRLV